MNNYVAEIFGGHGPPPGPPHRTATAANLAGFGDLPLVKSTL